MSRTKKMRPAGNRSQQSATFKNDKSSSSTSPMIAHTAVKRKSFQESFRAVELPPDLRPYAGIIHQLEEAQVEQALLAGVNSGLNPTQVCWGVVAAAKFQAATSHRCAACFAWVATHPFNAILDIVVSSGQYRYSALCDTCFGAFLHGDETEEMRGNIRHYLNNGGKR